MNAKRWISLCVSAMFALGFAGCVSSPKNEDTVTNFQYSDIYKYSPVKAEPLQGAAVYKASYGYTLMKEQGYNGFFYRYISASGEKDMTASDSGWTGGDASMRDGIMKSGNDSAVRLFISPVSGTARVYGNPRLVSGERATVTVKRGTEIVATYEITDGTGVWDEHILTLTEGEELRFIVQGKAEVYWNPTVDFIRADEILLHHATEGYYGDVHPFYDEKSGELYMFYLSTGQKNDQTTFRSMLTTSQDFIHFASKDVAISESAPPEQDLYFALNVYLDRDGGYRSSWGYNGYAGSSKSKDLLIWESGSEPYIDVADGFLKYTHRVYFGGGALSGRDPDVFYDKDSDSYYCVVMNYYTPSGSSGRKSLAVYLGDKDGRYSPNPITYMDFTGRGDPECPQIKKIGDRWYIFYSVYGTGTAGNVGDFRYRMGGAGQSVDQVDWDAAKEYRLDGADLHAAQIFPVGDKYYMYGWLNYAAGASVWGGYLNLAREVYRRADGTLATRCDNYLTSLLNKGKITQFCRDNSRCEGVMANDGVFNFAGEGMAALHGEYGRSLLTAKVNLGGSATKGGFRIVSGSNTLFAGVAIENDVAVLRLGTLTLTMDAFAEEYELKLIADGNFIELFVNDEYGLSANTSATASYSFGLSADAGAVIKDANVFKLADYNNIFD